MIPTARVEALTTVQRSLRDTYNSAYTRTLLQLQGDGDLAAFARGVQRACKDHGGPNCGWISHIANRNYAEALRSASDGKAGFSEKKRQQIFSYWLLGETNVPAQKIAAWQRQLDDRRSRKDDKLDRGWMLGSALVAGVQGKDDDALKLIDRFYTTGSVDWAWRANNRHETCRLLGMIGAVSEAVACLRTGLDEPSYVIPFLETRLPFYDGIRGEDEFVRLVEDLGKIEGFS